MTAYIEVRTLDKPIELPDCSIGPALRVARGTPGAYRVYERNERRAITRQWSYYAGQWNKDL